MNGHLIIQYTDIETFAKELAQAPMWRGYQKLLRRCTHQGKFSVRWVWYSSIRVIGMDKDIHIIDIPQHQYSHHPSELPENVNAMVTETWEKAEPLHWEALERLGKMVGEELYLTSAVLNVGNIEPIWASRDFLKDLSDEQHEQDPAK